MASAMDVLASTHAATGKVVALVTPAARTNATAAAAAAVAPRPSSTCRRAHQLSIRCPEIEELRSSLSSSLSLSASTSTSSACNSSSFSSSSSSSSSSLRSSYASTSSLLLHTHRSPTHASSRLACLWRLKMRTRSGVGLGRGRRLFSPISDTSSSSLSGPAAAWCVSSSSSSTSSSLSWRTRRGRPRSGIRGDRPLGATGRSDNGRGEVGTTNTSRSSSTIDIVATLKTERVLILGGSGFVGSAIAKSALKQGIEVVSLSRSGRSPYADDDGGDSSMSAESAWGGQVTWIKGDVFSVDWSSVLEGVTTVVSCVGGFGNNAQMERINGDANVQAAAAASQAGVSRFIYISVHDYNLPAFARSNGYFNGKQRAERAVLEMFPSTGVVLRPGFIYGKRKANGTEIPLDQIGEPLERLLAEIDSWIKPLRALPASDLLLLPPVSVQDVADAAVKAVIDDSVCGVLDVNAIKETAASLLTPV